MSAKVLVQIFKMKTAINLHLLHTLTANQQQQPQKMALLFAGNTIKTKMKVISFDYLFCGHFLHAKRTSAAFYRHQSTVNYICLHKNAHICVCMCVHEIVGRPSVK